MGTASTTKFIKNSAGSLAEQAALTTSAGAGDAQAIPALNASGILDSTIINSKQTSAGAGDAAKIVALDSTGRIDSSMMPVGVSSETLQIVASEALVAGNLVNIWTNAGVANVRKADGSTSGKSADGFVLAAYSAAATATVYMPSQANTQVSGLTPGSLLFLSDTVAGGATATVPVGAGKTVQQVGRAASATVFVFTPTTPIVLA